jgi:heme/copper-type cytochrome/quinol oxidase subunit 2
MMLIMVFVSVFVYSFVGMLLFKFYVKKDFGVDHCLREADVTGTVWLSIFWPITTPVLLAIVLAKYVWNKYFEGHFK